MVIIHFDPVVPVEYNVSILQTYFSMSVLHAHRHAIEVVQHGKTVAGVYTYEVAESKLGQVAMVSRENNIPFRLIMTPVLTDTD